MARLNEKKLKAQNDSTTEKFKLYTTLAELDQQHENLKELTAQRERTALDAVLEIAELEENLSQENANLRNANETLHKTMAEQSQQAAQDYAVVRQQLSPARQRAQQVQDLQNSTLQKLMAERAKNAELMAQLEALKNAQMPHKTGRKK